MKNGFTLIELLITLSIIGIFGALFFAPSKESRPVPVPQFTIQCINGYQYNIPENYRHSPTQVISENGGGVRCG